MAVAFRGAVRLPAQADEDTARLGRAVAREMGRELLREADRWSAGLYSRRDLVRMGHPYGIGRRPPGDPARINAQSGSFRAGWQLSVRRDGDVIRFTLENVAQYAGFLFGGTRRMIGRPLPERLAGFFERRVDGIVRGLLRR